jgi:hypothetical protein
VDPGSPSSDNKLFQNDVIAEVLYPAPRQKITNTSDLAAALERVRPGAIISLLVYAPGPNETGATRVVNIRTN